MKFYFQTIHRGTYRSKLWLWKWKIGLLLLLLKFLDLHSLATLVRRDGGPQTITPISTFPLCSAMVPKISVFAKET